MIRDQILVNDQFTLLIYILLNVQLVLAND